MTNLDSILKSRDIILPAMVCLVKTMIFQVVMYRCESWTIKKAEHRKIDAFENDPARQPGSLTCTGTPLTASGSWGHRCRGPPGTALCLCTAQSLEPAAVQDEVPLISRCDGRPGSCPPSPQASSCSAQRTPLGPHPKLTTPRPHRAPIFCPAV